VGEAGGGRVAAGVGAVGLVVRGCRRPGGWRREQGQGGRDRGHPASGYRSLSSPNGRLRHRDGRPLLRRLRVAGPPGSPASSRRRAGHRRLCRTSGNGKDLPAPESPMGARMRSLPAPWPRTFGRYPLV